MAGWKADLKALVQEARALAKSRVELAAPRALFEAPVPRTIIEPSRLPPVSLPKSERDENPRARFELQGAPRALRPRA
jgi:hypothetical protein